MRSRRTAGVTAGLRRDAEQRAGARREHYGGSLNVDVPDAESGRLHRQLQSGLQAPHLRDGRLFPPQVDDGADALIRRLARLRASDFGDDAGREHMSRLLAAFERELAPEARSGAAARCGSHRSVQIDTVLVFQTRQESSASLHAPSRRTEDLERTIRPQDVPASGVPCEGAQFRGVHRGLESFFTGTQRDGSTLDVLDIDEAAKPAQHSIVPARRRCPQQVGPIHPFARSQAQAHLQRKRQLNRFRQASVEVRQIVGADRRAPSSTEADFPVQSGELDPARIEEFELPL